MSFEVSDIVLSLNGRDAGKAFFVIAVDGDYALIADGRGRRLEKPKRKKLKHLSLYKKDDGRTAQKLRRGEKVTNGEIRRAIADRSEKPEAEGGMHNGER